MTAKLLGSENEWSRTREPNPKTGFGSYNKSTLNSHLEKCWVFILKYFDTSYLIFDSFWWDVPYFFTVPAPHTEKKGFDFYLFLLSSPTTVRKSESQGSLQNPEPGSKSDKQFALWKWLTNASKKEERKTVYFTFLFSFS